MNASPGGPVAGDDSRPHRARRLPTKWLVIGAPILLVLAWFLGRRVHWEYLRPTVGESLAGVERRHGPSAPYADGWRTIAYTAPFWWIEPRFVAVAARVGDTGCVTELSVGVL